MALSVSFSSKASCPFLWQFLMAKLRLTTKRQTSRVYKLLQLKVSNLIEVSECECSQPYYHVLVNKQIPAMEKVLADPTNEKHKPLIEAAFGKDSSLDLNKVKANVEKLKTGTVPVHLPTAPGSNTIAYNRYDADHPPMNPVHIEFGKKYHKGEQNCFYESEARTLTFWISVCSR